MSDHSDPVIQVPPLEEPPESESPVTSVADLFSKDTLAVTMAKFAVLDAFLRSLPKDVKFPDFVRDVLLAIMRVVKCEAGSILEVDHKTNTLFFRAVVGQSSDTITKFVIPMGKGIVGYVAESRQPLIVTNVRENEIHLKSIQNAVGFEARNLVAVPIVVRGQIYGVLELLNRIGEENFTSSDAELLTYLCEMAARAIEVRLMIAWANSKGNAA